MPAMPSGMPRTELSPELRAKREQIEATARSYGLDFYPVIFEVIPFDVMNQFAAYQGFPVRYPHWRWGMEYEKLSKRDAYGMGRIYEMVINTNPVYAYLQESNAAVDQKLVMSHVFGHADFFKNNFWFSQTNRKMLDEMANHATRVRRYADAHGAETVERFLDACLSIEGLIDPYAQFGIGGGEAGASGGAESAGGAVPGEDEDHRLPSKGYMEKFINPPEEMARQRRARAEAEAARKGRVPERPMRDLLAFLLLHARLEPWQQDVLGIVRSEAYYFAPQAMTKIMNEGWASYWHSKLMTQHFAEASEIVHYCDQHAGVIHMPAGGFNPYKIGLELFRDIERRWNTGQHGPRWEDLGGLGERERFDDGSKRGREKIFEVRRVYNDVTFIEEFLTPEFVEQHRMFQTRRDSASGEVRIASRDFERVKQTLLHHLTNRGEPFVYVADGNYLNRGELYLAHRFTGLEIDAAKAAEVLRAVRMIWGRPVHLQARYREDMCLFTCAAAGGGGAGSGGADEGISRQKISEDVPKPAHWVE